MLIKKFEYLYVYYNISEKDKGLAYQKELEKDSYVLNNRGFGGKDGDLCDVYEKKISPVNIN